MKLVINSKIMNFQKSSKFLLISIFKLVIIVIIMMVVAVVVIMIAVVAVVGINFK